MSDNTMKKVNNFRDDRNWRKFHNEKDLAISISLEASELLELFQWKSSKEVTGPKRQQIKEELADVLIYSYMMADNMDFDIDEIMSEKLKMDSEKYPIKKSFGNNSKYTEL